MMRIVNFSYSKNSLEDPFIAKCQSCNSQIANHRELLLNYFRAQKEFSSGIVEGLNNKAKVTIRKAYGFRTFQMTELALCHVLGKLSEPKLAHSFY